MIVELLTRVYACNTGPSNAETTVWIVRVAVAKCDYLIAAELNLGLLVQLGQLRPNLIGKLIFDPISTTRLLSHTYISVLILQDTITDTDNSELGL